MLYLALTKLYGSRPYFRPFVLEEKWPVIDLVVELVGEPGTMFLLQAKTTQAALVPGTSSIRVNISKKRLEQLAAAPMPAYLAAVHEPTGTSYIGMPRRIERTRSLPTLHDLSQQSTLLTLRDEVREFWRAQKAFGRLSSAFAF